MTWRRADRLDRQVADLWAVAAASAVALLPFWRAVLPALPVCPMRSLLGLPCPTCGATRAGHALADGQVLEAILYNPLVTVAALFFVTAGLTAPLWVRLGGAVPEIRASLSTRIALVAVLALNWTYVVARGV